MSESSERRAAPERERNRRLEAKRKKQRMMRIRAGIIVALALALLTTVTVLLLRNRTPAADPTIEGIWLYEDSTRYCFFEDKTGRMDVGNESYEYTYSVTDGTVSIDFVQDFLRDCKYAFTVKGDTMTLVGGEGTAGGEYRLQRQQER